jgi:hypothetical protein
MRYVVTYHDPARPGRGVRRFLYVESMGPEGRVVQHAVNNPPGPGWEFARAQPASEAVRYVAVPQAAVESSPENDLPER